MGKRNRRNLMIWKLQFNPAVNIMDQFYKLSRKIIFSEFLFHLRMYLLFLAGIGLALLWVFLLRLIFFGY